MVKINIGDKTNSDKRKFTTVSYTIDRDDVVAEILRLRKVFKVTPTASCCHLSNSLIPDYFFSKEVLVNQTDTLVAWFGCKYQNPYNWYKNSFGTWSSSEANKLHNHVRNLPDLIYKFECEVRNFCLKHSLGQRMERVVAHAVICNLVDERDINTVSVAIKEEDVCEGDKYFTTISGFLMTINHDATESEVMEVYREEIMPYQTLIKKDVDITVPNSSKRDKKGKSTKRVLYNHRKVREWYCRHVDGEPVSNFVLENDPESISGSEEGNIRQALHRYRKALKKRSELKGDFSSYPVPQLPQ